MKNMTNMKAHSGSDILRQVIAAFYLIICWETVGATNATDAKTSHEKRVGETNVTDF